MIFTDTHSRKKGRLTTFFVALFFADPKDLIPKKFSIPNLPTVVEDIKTSTNEAGGAVRVGNFGPILIQKTPVMGDAIYHESGDTLRLECLVDGSPVPTITWYKVLTNELSFLPLYANKQQSDKSKRHFVTTKTGKK